MSPESFAQQARPVLQNAERRTFRNICISFGLVRVAVCNFFVVVHPTKCIAPGSRAFLLSALTTFRVRGGLSAEEIFLERSTNRAKTVGPKVPPSISNSLVV
uniref:Uncharacterized protein n=1 Tax=Anopheles farauti TaxID=69004 RepID=A0A182QFW0_9DIPT